MLGETDSYTLERQGRIRQSTKGVVRQTCLNSELRKCMYIRVVEAKLLLVLGVSLR